MVCASLCSSRASKAQGRAGSVNGSFGSKAVVDDTTVSALTGEDEVAATYAAVAKAALIACRRDSIMMLLSYLNKSFKSESLPAGRIGPSPFWQYGNS